ncbi:MAG: hypothetical protein CMH27_01645 [Micavibrio sp.]|mgnify:CR=1 FL=1|nr:hypothetical protein [Micavibrio sp.]|tara:strand:+ start:788 stop:1432 length:645 start_codon:yes stop_codon:yes gene_type:complete
MQSPHIHKLSDFLLDTKRLLCIESCDDQILVQKLVYDFKEQGYSILLFLFALPAALPLPAIGLNLIIASPLLVLTGQQALGRDHIWMPKRIQQKSFKTATLEEFLDKAVPWVRRIEFFSRPRLKFMTHGIMRNIIGLAGFIMALSVAIPLPFTNTVPSFGIALMAFGVLMRDGLAVIAGMIIGACWVITITAFIFIFGIEGIDLMKDMIKQVLP